MLITQVGHLFLINCEESNTYLTVDTKILAISKIKAR